MADNPKDTRAQAEARFAKAQKRVGESQKARVDYEAAAHAAREKTSRLRAARLARDAAEITAQAKKKPSPPRMQPSR